MSDDKDRDRSRSSQAKSRKKITADHPPGIREPRLICGGIYSTEDLIVNLGVSRNTITFWVRDGLPSFSRNTRTQFFLADDLISYWREANTGK